jgi:hypothetical protein
MATMERRTRTRRRYVRRMPAPDQLRARHRRWYDTAALVGAGVLLGLGLAIGFWSVWMLSFLVGLGGYKDSADDFYLSLGGTGLLMAVGAWATALLLLAGHRGRLWLVLGAGALLAQVYPYVLNGHGYTTRPTAWTHFHVVLTGTALAAVVVFGMSAWRRHRSVSNSR